MSGDLNDLYQEMILDHSKRPRNSRALPPPAAKADGHNPLCGDKLTVYVQVEGDRIIDLSFLGSGCAISTASASLMTDVLKNKTLSEVETLFHDFHDVVTGKVEADEARLGKLAVFSGVSEFPIRVKCATLCWHTLDAALKRKIEPVSTE
jgi:nitrogen fixation NifU-like protein